MSALSPRQMRVLQDAQGGTPITKEWVEAIPSRVRTVNSLLRRGLVAWDVKGLTLTPFGEALYQKTIRGMTTEEIKAMAAEESPQPPGKFLRIPYKSIVVKNQGRHQPDLIVIEMNLGATLPFKDREKSTMTIEVHQGTALDWIETNLGVTADSPRRLTIEDLMVPRYKNEDY